MRVGPRTFIDRSVKRLPIQRIAARTRVSGQHDPRLFAISHLPVVEMVEAHGLNGRLDLIRREGLKVRFRKDELRMALDPKSNQEFLVWREAFEEKRLELYHYEAGAAFKLIAANHPKQKDEVILFRQAESLVLRIKGNGSNLRHLSFMLRKAAESGADHLTAAAILVHNLEDTTIRTGLRSFKKGSAPRGKLLDKLINLKAVSRRLSAIRYLPPVEGKMPKRYIQNFMDGMIKFSEGSGQALLLFLVHRFSSFMREREVNPQILRAIDELLAPLSERFGLINLAQGLRNEAFRIANPELFDQLEYDLATAAGMSREEAQFFLDKAAACLHDSKKLAVYQSFLINTRYKLPWEANEKTESRPEYYPEVLFLEDILGGIVVTEKTFPSKDALKIALEIAQEAVGDEFVGINYENHQTETKRHIIGDETCIVHHVSVKLKGFKLMEFQFMDRNSYEILERGARAHFAYKLERMLDQVFDREMLEECRKLMNGELDHDVKAVFDRLKSWIFVLFFDPRYSEPTLRILRRRQGSRPLDAATWIVRKDLSNYGGVEIKKVWDASPPASAKDERELKDGDLIEVKTGIGLSKADAARLLPLVKHASTRIVLHFIITAESFEKNVQIGEQRVFNLVRQKGLRFNRHALEEYAYSRRLTLSELFAAFQANFISAEDILGVLASK